MSNSEGLLCQVGSRGVGERAKRDVAVAVACVAVGLAFAFPTDARACTSAPLPTALVGYPANGQDDVPTDVVPFYDAYRARIDDVATAEFVLTSSEGDVVAVQAERLTSWHVDLVPAKALQPNTTYQLELSLPNGTSVSGVSFTTGAGPYEGEATPPTASLQHYQFAESVAYTSCSPMETGTCVALSDGLPVEVTHSWDGHADSAVYLYEQSTFTNLSGIDQGTPFDCISLRSRAPNRVYSTAIQLCREDGQLITVGSDDVKCTSEGLKVGNTRPETPGEPNEPDETPSIDEDGPGTAEGAAGANAIDLNAPGSNESDGCSVSASTGPGGWRSVALLLAAAAVSLRRAARKVK